ncbi:MAG: CDP-alcohol phosphatidyltransferase family protein [Victivallaceae bacterium]|nr:CDP-alcohol phosphatidyltransferase family protein [Victivallaceae bacterium]
MKTIVRREVKTRNTKWAEQIARFLCRLHVKPNHISIAGVFFAIAGAAALWGMSKASGHFAVVLLAIGAIAGIQGRLLCNLFDGMVAIEGGQRTKSGELFNDFPDRISDTFLLIGAGCATGSNCGVILGCIVAILSMMTAYVRVLGGAAGATQYFMGPMAKQHRMAILTLSVIVCIIVPGYIEEIMTGMLLLIGVGCVITVLRRLHRIYCELEKK